MAVKVGQIQAHETHWTRALVTQARANLASDARTARLGTEVVGITGLTTDDQYGTVEHGRHHNRRAFQPNLIHAVVVRQWQGKDDGPGGKTVCLTNGSVDKPLQPFDDDDDRSLMENCCIKETKQQWDLGHPPQKTERAVRVHVVFTLVMFAQGYYGLVHLAEYSRLLGVQLKDGPPEVGSRQQVLAKDELPARG